MKSILGIIIVQLSCTIAGWHVMLTCEESSYISVVLAGMVCSQKLCRNLLFLQLLGNDDVIYEIIMQNSGPR